MARTRVLIDTDPGVDDAVAILLALASPEIDLVGITTVAGNVSLDKTTLNARRLMDLVQRSDIPIASGCATPLSAPGEHGENVHGVDGLGDLEWAHPAAPLDTRHATELIFDLASQAPLTIVAIGPLTNIAVAFATHPEIPAMIEHLVVMGGASFEGNVTAAAEFNIWADPEAARQVFAASLPITVMPLDLTHQAFLNDDDLTYFRELGTEVGRRLAAMLEPYAAFHDHVYARRDVIMHDAMAVYEVIDATAITKQGVAVAVEVDGEHSRGATYFSRRHIHAASNVRVGLSVNNDDFRALVRYRLSAL